MKKTIFHGQAYEFYPWETLGKDIFKLSQSILSSKPHYDRIIALAKGGLTFSRSLVDYLKVENVSSIQIEFYTGIGKTAKTPLITQSLPVSIKNEDILIFDDIVDRGDTLALAIEYLKYHGAKSITTATLIQKPWTKHKADFVARDSEAWVIFPNEVRETIETLTELWLDDGDQINQIKSQLLEIGFTKDEVDLFANPE